MNFLAHMCNAIALIYKIIIKKIPAGIPFMDVVRVLSSILLLGNVVFTPGLGDDAFDVELMGKDELNSVAKLLGISSTLLWQGLTMRTHSVRGQPIQSMSDSHMVCTYISISRKKKVFLIS